MMNFIGKAALFFLLISSVFNTVEAQQKGFPSQMLQSMDLQSELSPDIPGEAFPSANSVDPDYYYLSQGDVLSLLLVPQKNKEIELTVYPDNSVIIPLLNMGISIEGMTLSELKDTIAASQKIQTGKSGRVFLSLKKPKQAIITIRGNVATPGVYTLSGAMKISTAIEIGNKLEKTTAVNPQEQAQEMQDKSEYRALQSRFENYGSSNKSEYWRRNVTVIHEDGTSDYLDLELGTAGIEPTENPYIMPGDIISVPFEKGEYPSISVFGEVSRPLTVPYKKGDKASYLWAFGRGATEMADLSKIRYVNSSGAEKDIELSENQLQEDFFIEPGSSILVPEIKVYSDEKVPIIAVKGQVRNPGYYVFNDDESLQDLIRKAGGLTDKAYLPLAYINRRSLDQKTFDNRTAFLESFINSDLTLEDTLRYNIDFMTKKPVVAVDFEAAFNGETEVDLLDGDIIVIPDNPNRVYVFGRVNNPGFVKYNSEMDLRSYLAEAGGITDIAKEERIRIIRGNTNVWVEPGENTLIYAGDQIYVPGEQDVPLIAQQQQNQLYVAIAQAAVFLGSLILQTYDVFSN
jgi:protein involved in polysaccharide export with SLBB domain